MMDQQSSFLAVDSINYTCYGCSKPIFSDVESDEQDLPDHLLNHFLDKSRSVKQQVITDRPCYHGRLETPIIEFNVAALQLSHDLLDKIEHIPKTIIFTEKCSAEDFFNLLGCRKDSTEIITNIIVFKLIPEDIEDENPTERLYEHLIENENFCFTKLKCEIFNELYILPLPKENEPPAFLPITSRLNLENCPREDNVLLGVLVKKPPLEEGEISGESNQTTVKVYSPILSEILSPVSPVSPNFDDTPPSSSKNKPSSHNNSPSPSTLEKIKSGLDSTFKLIPADRYGSYIGASTEDIPFLTDPVATLQSVTAKKSHVKNNTNSVFATLISRKLTEDISSDSEGELGTSANTKPTNRKRTLPVASQSAHKKSPEQNKQQRDSSSKPNILSATATATKSQSTSIVSSKEPAIVNTSPKKLKMSANDVIDLESSESDPDADLFPRQPNNAMTGIFTTTFGDFEFKYHVIRTDRPVVKKYLPPTLSVKGRARAPDCEQCLYVAKHKPNVKMILFQILPRETSEAKRIFGNFATYLINRDRYGLLDYKPEAYRAYVLPVVKGTTLMKAFEILKLKPRGKYQHELYGLIIKKSAMVPVLQINPQSKVQSLPSTSSAGRSATQVQATSSTFANKEGKATESSEFHNTNLKAKYGPENFPQLDVNRLANLIHSSVDDLLSLSANVANLLQKTTENDSDAKKKEEATLECQSKVIFIMGLEEQQHAKRKKAYETILSWLKTLTS